MDKTDIERPSPLLRALSVDEIANVYIWLLGRHISQEEAIGQFHAHINGASLRENLLRSPEFMAEVDRLGLLSTFDRQNWSPEAFLPESHERLVFLAIPMAGANLVRRLFLEGSVGRRVCPEHRNRLSHRTGRNLAPYDLFFGNFDVMGLRAIPGRIRRTATILAEPRGRLLATYAHLRAVDPVVAADGDFELCRAARELDLAEFLQRAVDVNPAAIDNAYARFLGGQTSPTPWQCQADTASLGALDDATGSEILTLALQTIADSYVGLAERIEESRALFRVAFNLDARTVLSEERRDAEAYQGRYDWSPPPAPNEQAKVLICQYTRLDRVIYEAGQRRFELLQESICHGLS